MKKICMIVPSFNAKGGITSVVNGYKGSALEDKYQITYIETYCDGGKIAKLFKALSGYFRFIKELMISRPDLIHIHSSFGASFYRKAPFIYIGSMLQIPVVNHIHGAQWGSFYLNSSERSKHFKRSTLKKCHRIIALSEEWKKNLEAAVDTDKVVVVKNYSIIPETEKSDQTGLLNDVLFLGFLSERKGVFDIPAIAAQVWKSVENVTFTLAGSGSDADVQRLMHLTREYGAEECISFPGWVRDVQKNALLRRAALFFLPSYAEGMPMAILEAMGYGLPVVSTTVGGIPELVQHGKNGFLLEPGDTDGFAEAIITLLKDPEKRNEMGRQGRIFVQKNYSLEKHISSLMNVYDSLAR